jgi:hypothetical protein
MREQRSIIQVPLSLLLNPLFDTVMLSSSVDDNTTAGLST